MVNYKYLSFQIPSEIEIKLETKQSDNQNHLSLKVIHLKDLQLLKKIINKRMFQRNWLLPKIKKLIEKQASFSLELTKTEVGN